MALSSRFFLGVAATPAFFFAAACSRAPAHDKPPAPIVKGERVEFPVNAPPRAAIAVAEPRASEIHRLTGRVVWNEDATVRIYAPVAGRVVSMVASLGEPVEPDAPLVRIASADFGQAQADVRKANADLLLATRTLARTKDLFEHGATARKEFEAAEDAHAAAQSEQQRATARLKLFGAADGEVDGLFTLRSPIAGTVVEKNLNLGQEVRPDQMLANASQLLAPHFVVSDPRRFWVMLDATEMDMALLKPGLKLHMSNRALPGRVFEGRLDIVGDSLDAVTRTVKARGSVANADRLLKAEMYVDVEIEAEPGGGGAVAIASAAVFAKDDRNYVFVEIAPGTFERREVQTGPESAGKILIRGGLRAGEHVVVEGALLVEAAMEAGGKS